MSEIIQIIEESPTIVQVFSELTINNTGGVAAQAVSFTQSVAASVWTFNHTLNRRPAIQVTDLAGNLLFVETQATLTQAIVKSESPVTGIVYLT
jgi:hypothetical protein